MPDAFWDAVESGDASGLLDELGLVGDEPLNAVLPVLASWRRGLLSGGAGARSFAVAWEPLAGLTGSDLTGQWLVAGTGSVELAEVLAAGGADVERLALDSGVDRVSLGEELSGFGDVTCVVVDGAAVELAWLVTLIQALGDVLPDVPVWCVTSGAVSVA